MRSASIKQADQPGANAATNSAGILTRAAVPAFQPSAQLVTEDKDVGSSDGLQSGFESLSFADLGEMKAQHGQGNNVQLKKIHTPPLNPGTKMPMQLLTIKGKKIKNLDDVFGKGFSDSKLNVYENNVVTTLLESRQNFNTPEDLYVEIKMRAMRIKQIEDLNKNKMLSFAGGNEIKLPSTDWRPVPYKVTEHTRRSGNIIWASTSPAASAINSIQGVTKKHYIDCYSAVVIADYLSILELLGDDQFNELFREPILIGLESVVTKVGGRGPLDSDEIKTQEKEVKDEEDLVPGDHVYFINEKDYSQYAPTGNWAGEHAIYIGDNKFIGFGASNEPLSSVEMKQKLKDQYVEAKKEGKKNEKIRPQNLETVDGVYPGMYKIVNKEIKFKNVQVIAELIKGKAEKDERAQSGKGPTRGLAGEVKEEDAAEERKDEGVVTAEIEIKEGEAIEGGEEEAAEVAPAAAAGPQPVRISKPRMSRRDRKIKKRRDKADRSNADGGEED